VFKKILIPMDGSEFAQDALEQGFDLARLSGGEVTILYAIENPYELVPSYAKQPPEHLEQQMNEYKAQARQVLSRISAEAESKGIRARTVIVEQHPVPAILEAAKEHDLVVMATHGRKGIDRVLMGSVTDKVLHNCSTPVLVVRCLCSKRFKSIVGFFQKPPGKAGLRKASLVFSWFASSCRLLLWVGGTND